MNNRHRSQSTQKIKIAVGVSGGGRSLINLIEEQKNHWFDVALVFSSSHEIAANDVARKYNIPLLVLDFGKSAREASAETLYATLEKLNIDLVVLAGFLKLLPVKSQWSQKVINIHPALLPKFGGKGMHGHHVHEAVISAGETKSGATIHYVNEKYDEGGIIARAIVEIESTWTADELAREVFEAEKKLLPTVIHALAQGTLPETRVKDYQWKNGGLK